LEPGAQLERLTGLLANNTILPGAFYLWIIEQPVRPQRTGSWRARRRREAGELVCRRLSELPARGHQGAHHTARAGLGTRRPGSDSSRAHIARAGRCRTPRPVHGPRCTGRALDADCRTSADVLSVKSPRRSLKIAALEHRSELTTAHSGGSVVLVQREFEVIGPVAVSASRHAKLSGQLARETVTRNG